MKILRLMGIFLAPVRAMAFEGSYAAPVSAELRPYADSVLSSIAWQEDSSHRLTLAFVVPDDLTGPDHVVVSVREVGRTAAGYIEMSGVNAWASCIPLRQTVVCLLKYNRLAHDAAAVNAHLTARYADAEVRQGKISVAAEFSTEPAGILEIRL